MENSSNSKKNRGAKKKESGVVDAWGFKEPDVPARSIPSPKGKSKRKCAPTSFLPDNSPLQPSSDQSTSPAPSSSSQSTSDSDFSTPISSVQSTPGGGTGRQSQLTDESPSWLSDASPLAPVVAARSLGNVDDFADQVTKVIKRAKKTTAKRSGACPGTAAATASSPTKDAQHAQFLAQKAQFDDIDKWELATEPVSTKK